MNSFTAHNQTVPLAGIIAPRPTTTELRRLSPALLSGDKNKVDAFADEMIQRELREANSGIEHRLSPEEVEDYARARDRAQRKLGVREVKLTDGQF